MSLIPPSDISASCYPALSGVKVIELGHSVAAPFAGQILADLGAEVIKIERPGVGDDARHWGPPFWHDASATFQAINRKKRSVCLDIKSAEGIEQLKRLVDQADVLIQNMRPGLLRKLGLGADGMSAVNPRLIYCNVAAFGEVGPWAERPGYDPLMQATGGIMSVTGENGRPPIRVGPSLVDMGAGMWAVIGILSALYRRALTNRGCQVDTSLYETALCWMTIPIATTLAAGTEPGKTGSETPMLAPYKAYESQDRYIVIGVGSDGLFGRLCDVLGNPEWTDDDRFKVNAARVRHRTELNRLIEQITLTRPAAHWVKRLEQAGVPCALVRTVTEVIEDDQTRALGMIEYTEDAKMRLVGLPISFDGVRPNIGGSAPLLGSSSGFAITSR